MNTLDELLSFDPIDATEQMGGTTGDAFVLQMIKSQMMDEILSKMDDTLFSDKFERTISLIESSVFNFKLEYKNQFNNPFDHLKEEERIYWSEEKGIVIYINSHCSNHNSLKAYFALEYTPKGNTREEQDLHYNNEVSPHLLRMSHGPFYLREDGYGETTTLMVGTRQTHASLDGRGAMFYRLMSIDLSPYIHFAKEWNEQPFLWFVNYEEDKVPGYSYENITQSKIAQCSEAFQKFLKGKV
jgi:hypothetical protein